MNTIKPADAARFQQLDSTKTGVDHRSAWPTLSVRAETRVGAQEWLITSTQ